ncbi:MAG: hypothetical protein R3324_03515 [Halobacteriales archaeon]|nr:hypothetical protein [Halobacteriales archaeon]
MAAENFFGDSMTLSVDTTDGTPVSVPVGSLQQVQITVSADHVELTSADTILREDVAKRNLNVGIIAGVAAFDMTIVEEWLGGDNASSSSPTDDNTVATFTLVGTITSPGGTTHTATVDEVYFPSLPVMNATAGQWVQHNIEGDGQTITIS